jgi:hypothetical protein
MANLLTFNAQSVTISDPVSTIRSPFWNTITLLNNWTNSSGWTGAPAGVMTFPNARYTKVDGMVYVEGLIEWGGSGDPAFSDIVFNFPSGYRPGHDTGYSSSASAYPLVPGGVINADHRQYRWRVSSFDGSVRPDEVSGYINDYSCPFPGGEPISFNFCFWAQE